VTPGAVGAAEVFVGAVGGWGPAEAVIVVEGAFGGGGEEVVCGDDEAVAFESGGGRYG
jgi:hypothetical protein